MMKVCKAFFNNNAYLILYSLILSLTVSDNLISTYVDDGASSCRSAGNAQGYREEIG